MQNTLAQKLFWRTMNHVPTFMRKEFTHQHGATTPVVKLRHPPHVAKEAFFRTIPPDHAHGNEAARTVVLHVNPEFPISEEQIKPLIDKLNEQLSPKAAKDATAAQVETKARVGDAVQHWEVIFPVPDELKPGMFNLNENVQRWANDVNAGATAIRIRARDTEAAIHRWACCRTAR